MRAIKEKLKVRVERAQQPRGDRREVYAIEDCWLWPMIVRKFIFKNNHRAKTKICGANIDRP